MKARVNFCPKAQLPVVVQVKTRQGQNPDRVRRAPRIVIGQRRFSEARARVTSLGLRGLKVYNIFNGTTMIGKILKIMLSRLFQIAILE